MQFTTATIALLSLISSITAASLPESVNLWNGEGVTSTGVGARDILQSRAPINYCSGSAFCDNKQSFKDACVNAHLRLQDTTYKNDGE